MSVGDQLHVLAPTLGFLAAVLVLGHLCEREGLFAAAGRLLAGHADDRPPRLLALVFALAAGVTAVLGLDATVALLTPVVLASAAQLRLRPRPHVYACVHLANAASLLLPVSNLTNLLAFHSTDISFARFAALMALPWVVVIAVEWVALRSFFAGDLRPPERVAGKPPRISAAAERGSPMLAAVVVAATLVGFAFSTPLGVDPAWFAAAGAVVLAVPALVAGRTTVAAIVRAASPGFLLFVLVLGVAVAGALSLGLGDVVDDLLPRGDGLLALLGVSSAAALLANAINNLPATLILLPALAQRGTGPLLAALIGVNVGPNLTYTGSLATLLWKRVLRGTGAEGPRWRTFLGVGALSVPPALLAGTTALWLALHA